MSELPREFNKITDEITKITAKMIDFEERLDQAENTTTNILNGIGFIETEYQTQKADLEYIKSNMVSKDEMNYYIKEAIVDLSNRTRCNNLICNNLIIHNVAEAQEIDDSLHYVKDFVSNTVGVKDVEIEAAHPTPTSRLKQNADNPHPRIIHAKILKRNDWD